MAVRAWWSSCFSAARVAAIWARSFSYSGRRWSTSPGPVSGLCGFLRSRLKLPALIVSMETRQACSFSTRDLKPSFSSPHQARSPSNSSMRMGLPLL